MAILEAQNLTKVYGRGAAAVTALNGVNLSVAP
jgi:ABC-type multidrug transport system ATPase subunit